MTDTLPPQSDVERELHHFLAEASRPMRPTDAYKQLAAVFHLSAQQLSLEIENASGRENAWENRVRQARRRLKDEGWLDGSVRGRWSLTLRGKGLASLRHSSPGDIGI
jgi:restriction endonuclease Mrr